MNIASKIKKQVESTSWNALTIEYMYGMTTNHQRVMFDGDPPKVLKTKRNPQHRVTYQSYMFTDRSVIVFRWSDARGSTYEVFATLEEYLACDSTK